MVRAKRWSGGWDRPETRAGLLLFLALSLVAATLGIADDEAYYWALAQSPRGGFAYHPPGVLWGIALTRFLFGGLSRAADLWVLRLSSVFCATFAFVVAMRWVRRVFGERASLAQIGILLVSFPGLFALGWMAVPDWGLLAGMTLLWSATWSVCFSPVLRGGERELAGLAAGAALVMVCKLSGVLPVLSAVLCIAVWSTGKRRGRALAVLALGAALGGFPFLLWNARHEWVALLYQVRDRHGGWSDASVLRMARFWGVQLLACGAPLVAWTFWLLRSGLAPERRTARFAALWIFPPLLLYGLQPLWGESKPHWGFVAFWPALMVWAGAKGDELWRQARRFQVIQAAVVSVLALLTCYTPLLSRAGEIWSGRVPAPTSDIGNDFWGWQEFAPWLAERGRAGLPVLASRYQVAGQAAFALRGTGARVEQVPRDARERADWKDLGVTSTWGPGWPRLVKRALFVADSRYSDTPQFAGARCVSVGRLETTRHWWGRTYPGRWIEGWDCEPTTK